MRYRWNGSQLGSLNSPTAFSANGLWNLATHSIYRRVLSQWPRVGDDPFGSLVVLLLRMDGANGSTSFVDSSLVPKAITRFGNTQVSTTIVKYGTGSGFFDGSGDYLRSNHQFNSGDTFTIEGWIYRTGSPIQGTILEIGDINGSPARGGLHFGTTGAAGTFFCNNALAGAISGGTAPLNQWVHWAIVRNNNITTLYVGGASVGTTTQTISPINNIFSIGGAPNYNFYMQGYLDEFRITYGFARYTSNFTPPTSAFPNP